MKRSFVISWFVFTCFAFTRVRKFVPLYRVLRYIEVRYIEVLQTRSQGAFPWLWRWGGEAPWGRGWRFHWTKVIHHTLLNRLQNFMFPAYFSVKTGLKLSHCVQCSLWRKVSQRAARIAQSRKQTTLREYLFQMIFKHGAFSLATKQFNLPLEFSLQEDQFKTWNWRWMGKMVS